MIIKKLMSRNYLGVCEFLPLNKPHVSKGREIEQEKINRSNSNKTNCFSE